MLLASLQTPLHLPTPLYRGHEIAEHTVTHPDLHKLSSAKKKEEILGARDWIIKCGVPASEVVGHRSPYLSDDVEVRSILNDNGYLYDTSIPEVYPSPTSPSAAKRLLPYSMWEGNKMVYSCKWFDNINHCTTTEKPNIYELPMWMYQKAPNTAATSDLMDPTTPFVTLKRELDRNLVGNRAPVGAWTHSSATDYLTKA